MGPGAPRDLQEQPIGLNLPNFSKHVAKMIEKLTPNGPQNRPKIDPGAQNVMPEAHRVAIFYDFSSHHRFSMICKRFLTNNQ